MKPGLVSVTFRKLSPREVVALVAEAGLAAIEWGGDVHVPHGDEAAAAEVGVMTRDAGLSVAAYGSYYRVGHPDKVDFDAVLACAVELDAPIIRVWPGRKGSAEADDAYRDYVVEDSRRIADKAAAAGVVVAYEYHRNTLTDTNDAALALLERVDHENVKTYWQPAPGRAPAECVAGLEMIVDRLVGLHAYTWDRETGARQPLADGRDEWTSYISHAARADADGEMFIGLEFVADDKPENFLADAKTLKKWLGG